MKKILFTCLFFLAIILTSSLLHFYVAFLPSSVQYPFNGLLILFLLFLGISIFVIARKTQFVQFFLHKQFLSISCLYYFFIILILLFLPKQISCNAIGSIKQWNAYWGTFFLSAFFVIGLTVRLTNSFCQELQVWIRQVFLFIGLIFIVFYLQWGSNDIVQKELMVGKQAIVFLRGGDSISLQDIDFEKNNPTVTLQILEKDTINAHIKANYPFHYKGWDILLKSCDTSEKKSWVKLCFVYDIWKQTFKIGVAFVFLQIIVNLLLIPIFVNRNKVSKTF